MTAAIAPSVLHASAAALLAAGFLLAAPPSEAQPLPSPLEQAQAKKREEIKIGYLRQLQRNPPPASRLDAEPADIGVAGIETALRENNAAGQFTGHNYTVVQKIVSPDDDPTAALDELLKDNIRYIVVDAPAARLLELAEDAEQHQALLFNIRAPETSLRQEDCRSNVLHVAPDRTMLADALAQYLVTEDWKNGLLVAGDTENDRAYADALKRSAERFGATIVDERVYKEVPGRDRDDIGTIPPPSQGDAEGEEAGGAFDVIVAADESNEWSVFAPYRGGSEPRPVAGSSGLMPMSWHGSHSKWGARQLNAHFEEEHHRLMLPVDYHGYIAARSIGEAVTRNRNASFQQLKEFIHGDKFQLNGFKGVKHTYRSWDGQFRQPVLIATDRIVVSVSPQPGFAHAGAPDRLIDTLGIDEDESRCKF